MCGILDPEGDIHSGFHTIWWVKIKEGRNMGWSRACQAFITTHFSEIPDKLWSCITSLAFLLKVTLIVARMYVCSPHKHIQWPPQTCCMIHWFVFCSMWPHSWRFVEHKTSILRVVSSSPASRHWPPNHPVAKWVPVICTQMKDNCLPLMQSWLSRRICLRQSGQNYLDVNLSLTLA